MSTDPSAAIGRIDAAVEEFSRQPVAPPRELADLAAVIKRIELLVVDGTAQRPDGTAAVEHASDVTSALHEQDVETSLCDALDSAVREINEGGAVINGSAERAQQAGELLRELSRRVRDMIAQSQTNRRSEPAPEENAAQISKRAQHAILDEGDGEDDTAHDGSFKTDVPEDDEFALVVAALTAALPSLAEFGAPMPVPSAARDAEPVPGGTLPPELSAAPAAEARTAENEAVPPAAEASGETAAGIEPSSEPVLPQTPSSEAALGEDFLRDLLPRENPAAEPSADAVSSLDAPVEDLTPKGLLALPTPNAPTAPPHEAGAGETQLPRETEEQHGADAVVATLVNAANATAQDGSSDALLPLVAPDDDPGDLFDSVMPAPSIEPMPERPGVQAAEKVSEPDRAVQPLLSVPTPLEPEPPAPPPMPPQQSRAAAAAQTSPQPVSRPASTDPLGPIRALTEEETIALFS